MLSLVIFVAMALALAEAAPGNYGHYKGYYYKPAPYFYYKPAHTYHYQHHGHARYPMHPMHHPMMKMPEMKPMEEVDVRAEAPAPLGDVVDVAVGAGSFSTLVKLVTDLELVEYLKGAEALTVFAPSDEAFAKLPEGTLESLTPEQAKAIVLRHVVTAKVPAADVATGDVETIGGESIGLVKTPKGGVQIKFNGNTVNVVAADVMASNGVIHVIDAVIL